MFGRCFNVFKIVFVMSNLEFCEREIGFLRLREMAVFRK